MEEGNKPSHICWGSSEAWPIKYNRVSASLFMGKVKPHGGDLTNCFQTPGIEKIAQKWSDS